MARLLPTLPNVPTGAPGVNGGSRAERAGYTGRVAGIEAPSTVRDRFLRACRHQPVDRTPVWFMRQAGRYLPEYRSLRGDTDVLTLTRDPEAAAILFGDIRVPVAASGMDARIARNQGPPLPEPFHGDADLERLRPLDP